MINESKTVYIIDDNTEVCRELQSLFASASLPVKICTDAASYFADDDYHQGCLIMVIKPSDTNGLRLLDELKASGNLLPVLVITESGDIEMAVEAMKRGASEFMTRPLDHQHLLAMVINYLNTSSAKTGSPVSTKRNLLTKREQQVIDLILEGKFNKEIAEALNISNSTVEAHRARIMKKFQAKNVVQLIKKYYKITEGAE